MALDSSPERASLLDVLVDGFEKNETMHGFHWRVLPLSDEAAAVRKFATFAEEAERWKGPPLRRENIGRRLVAWNDMEIRQAGRGIMVLARDPLFRWWHEQATWEDDPMGPLHDWLREEPPSRPLR